MSISQCNTSCQAPRWAIFTSGRNSGRLTPNRCSDIILVIQPNKDIRVKQLATETAAQDVKHWASGGVPRRPVGLRCCPLEALFDSVWR